MSGKQFAALWEKPFCRCPMQKSEVAALPSVGVGVKNAAEAVADNNQGAGGGGAEQLTVPGYMLQHWLQS